MIKFTYKKPPDDGVSWSTYSDPIEEVNIIIADHGGEDVWAMFEIWKKFMSALGYFMENYELEQIENEMNISQEEE